MKLSKAKLVQIGILFCTAAVLAWIAFTDDGNQAQTLKLQQSFPEFEHLNMSGESIRSDELAGQPMMINFWATWCTPCINELPLLNEAQKFAPDVQLVAINMGDDASEINKFIERYGLSMTILQDQNLYWRKSYAINSYPLTILVDRNGTITKIVEGELTNFAEIIAMMQELQAL